jgi:hypothetical protein
MSARLSSSDCQIATWQCGNLNPEPVVSLAALEREIPCSAAQTNVGPWQPEPEHPRAALTGDVHEPEDRR